MKVLIIGGTGCISSAILSECISNKLDVTIINRGHRKSNIPDGIRLIIADKNDVNTIQKSICNDHFDAVIDFLCYNADDIKKSFSLYSKVTSQYFFISSAQVYDYPNIDVSFEDSSKVDSRWDYSINKWAAEECLRDLSQKTNTAYTIIRPSITYGDTRIPYGITPPYGKHGTIIKRVLLGKPIIRWNEGKNLCNMMRVEDFAKFFVPLIGNKKAYNQEFNICGNNVYSFEEVLHAIEENLKVPVKTIDLTPEEYAAYIPERRGELIAGRSTDCKSSSSKVKSIIPFVNEEYDIKSGVAKTIDAYVNNYWMDGMDYSFDGICDKAVKDWCNRNNYNPKDFNIGFIDYLGNASWKDKISYYCSFHKGRLDAKILKFATQIYNKLI